MLNHLEARRLDAVAAILRGDTNEAFGLLQQMGEDTELLRAYELEDVESVGILQNLLGLMRRAITGKRSI